MIIGGISHDCCSNAMELAKGCIDDVGGSGCTDEMVVYSGGTGGYKRVLSCNEVCCDNEISGFTGC